MAKANLPSARVRFGDAYLERLGRLVVRVRAARERREGSGRASLVGAGSEFVGYRPYRAGEDLRGLDWGLYARLRRPFVRVARRESSEHWALLVDTSGSMAVGAPSKWQTAAEVALALAAVGLRGGAWVDLHLSSQTEPLRLRRGRDLRSSMAHVERLAARGERGLAHLVAEPARYRAVGAVFLVGDLLDLTPAQALGLGRRGRDLCALQVLAEDEWSAGVRGPVRWVDAETGRTRELWIDQDLAARYEGEVGRELEAWGQSLARHRAFYGNWVSGTPFETPVAAVFGEA